MKKFKKLEVEIKYLIKRREQLRKKESKLTQEIKKKRKQIHDFNSASPNFEDHPVVKQARKKLNTLRISASEALKKAGYKNSEISKILNISYSRLRELKIRLDWEVHRESYLQSHREYQEEQERLEKRKTEAAKKGC